MQTDDFDNSLAIRILDGTDNLLIQGRAGTGKSTLVRQMAEILYQRGSRYAVLAFTGVAAQNSQGQTIHSFFGLPMRPFLPNDIALKFDVLLKNTKSEHRNAALKAYETNNQLPTDELLIKGEKMNPLWRLITSLDILIIDEISMVRVDLMAAVDQIMQTIRQNTEPFGGVRVLLIGDIYQLAPYIDNDQKEVLGRYFDTHFFWGSDAFKRGNFKLFGLKKVYRQSEAEFLELLSVIRRPDHRLRQMLAKLNQRALYRLGLSPTFNEDNTINLVNSNAAADKINEVELARIRSDVKVYYASKIGKFESNANTVAPSELKLKVGARVICLVNNQSVGYMNGSIGLITELNHEKIEVLILSTSNIVTILRHTWHNYQYTYNPEKHVIETEIIGSYIQFPVKLAYAITVHKSQGMTLDSAIIDLGNGYYSIHGLAYVALSRVRTFRGIYLKREITEKIIHVDPDVEQFFNELSAQSGSDGEE